ncbi:sugar porter family MFS transporter [Sciscionella sediminilitoris]|uniref:sugar porter family MFS transporter n=1 Tax=Sciscionella sediminilitoris TaxID=1445613 RepID=UPI00055DAE88|nr:sugar porter family MFS transporter [Sciscionella sp. SE31]
MTRLGVRRASYFFGALGGLLFGYDLGVVAGALLSIGPELGLSAWAKGMVTSSLIVGAMLGALGSAWLADRLGRRGAILVSGLVFILGCLVASIGLDFPMLLGGRSVMGLAVGAFSMTIPIYLAELAPAGSRGALSGLNQLLISSGILIAYLVTTALDGPGQWHYAFGIAMIPALLLVIGIVFQPESPRWLVKKGRTDKARVILERRGEDAETALAEIRALLGGTRTPIGALLREPSLRRVLVIGVGIAFLQQIIGINTIIYYAPTILTTLGFADSAALLANAGLGALTVVVTVIMLLVVDRIGRRRPMILGAIGMTICMLALGTVFLGSGSAHTGGLLGWVAIIALALFKVSFSMSWGGMGWIIPGEIFPLRVRETAMSLATFANWSGNLLVGLFFPVLLVIGTGIVFYLFAAIGVLATVFAVRLIPETKGKSLERIEFELTGTAAKVGHFG